MKQDHGMRRCWRKGQTGDVLHAVLCAAGYDLRWLLRAIARMGIKPVFFALALLRLFTGLVEKTIGRLPLSVTFLRPGWFMGNTLWDMQPRAAF
jgi:hypothetical protein